MQVRNLMFTLCVPAVLMMSGFVVAPAVADKGKSAIEQGKSIAFERSKGNCLACHLMAEGESPGNIAPPLIAMKSRYPEKDKLRAQIWDAAVRNPETSMPPFGKHKILSDTEIDLLVEYIWSL